MIHGARSFAAGLAICVALAAPARAQTSVSPPDRPLGDTLRFLSKPPAAPHRPVRRALAALHRGPQFLLVPVAGPFGLAYVRVPAYPVVYVPPPVYRVPLYAYRPFYAYRPVFVPVYPYRYGVPVY